jgi:4-amino-4-deoxy-L-arabinose transferase-like glycosyltransferase
MATGSSVLRIGKEHWIFLLLLAAGAALRAVTFFAYGPALIRRDSIAYVLRSENFSPGPLHPSGYAAFLRALPLDHGLAVVPFLQHVMGLAIAVLLYGLLLRLGVHRWLSALAAAPVLLDAYQLNIEENIMSDTLFELLLVSVCALILWRRPLGWPWAAGAGFLLALATLTRTVGLLLIVAVTLAVLFLVARHSRFFTLAALVAAFALPVIGYAAWFNSYYGQFGLTSFAGRFLYGRVAPFADCTKFSVPADERVLCPDDPRLTPEQYVWKKRSPVFRVGPGVRNELAGHFAKRVILHQPLMYARVVGRDFIRAFSFTRGTAPGEPPASKWQFQLDYPLFSGNGICPPPATPAFERSHRCPERQREWNEFVREHGDKGLHVNRGLASFLRSYQRFGYLPGPVLAAALFLAVLAVLGVGRARGSGLRTAAFLLGGVVVVLILGTVAANHFAWRYGLPPFMLIPAAAAIGLTALTAPSAGGESGRTGLWGMLGGRWKGRREPVEEASP